ncbi:MAG TPA: exonuclease domain-containing protein [Protaetiibacter sp.]|nr:exonuclease domain-containing protein [Protaetiibacter sp.]
MNFVAIDFETAQKRRASPIQIGVVRVIDAVIGTAQSSFVMPPQGFRDFDPELIAIHGITPPDIQGAPEWPEILRRLDRFTTAPDGSRLPLVAHNASFERSVIRQTSAEYGLDDLGLSYLCTVKAARLLDPGSPNHKLATLAERYGIAQVSHHDAGDDARVGALLALHLLGLPGGADGMRRAELR